MFWTISNFLLSTYIVIIKSHQSGNRQKRHFNHRDRFVNVHKRMMMMMMMMQSNRIVFTRLCFHETPFACQMFHLTFVAANITVPFKNENLPKPATYAAHLVSWQENILFQVSESLLDHYKHNNYVFNWMMESQTPCVPHLVGKGVVPIVNVVHQLLPHI